MLNYDSFNFNKNLKQISKKLKRKTILKKNYYLINKFELIFFFKY